MALIEEMLNYIDTLINELSSCTSVDSCIPIQKNFTQTVKEAMNLFKEGKITVDVKALPLTMYYWATEELPDKIKNINNLKSIRDQLTLFKNSIIHILNPEEHE